MKHSHRASALVTAAAFGLLRVSDAFAGCVDVSAGGQISHDRRVDSNTTLYVMDSRGVLSRTHFDGRDLTRLSDHGFEDANAETDASHRWVAYSGAIGDSDTYQYWLFDVRTGSDRLLLSLPWNMWDLPTFSPDGRHLALFAGRNQMNLPAVGTGLYLFDTDTAKARWIGMPPGDPHREDFVGVVEWAADGGLLVWIGHEPVRGYRVDVQTGRYSSIDLKRVPDSISSSGHLVFLDAGREIPMAEQAHPPSPHFTPPAVPAADGWSAVIDDAHGLIVTTPSGQSRRVMQGSYSQCEGRSNDILGWLDGHDYLIYRQATRIFAYDTAHDASVEIFDGAKNDVHYLFW